MTRKIKGIYLVLIIMILAFTNMGFLVLADISDFTDNSVDSDSDIDSQTIGNSQGSYINAQSLNSVYQNITEGNGNQYDSGSNFEDYTDGKQDVYSPSDLGSYSNWGTMILTDSSYNTLIEENTGSAGNNIEDFTDTLTNTQNPADLGSYTDFNEMKDIDDNYNSLIEEDTGSAGNNVEDYLDGITDQYSPSDLGSYSNWALMDNKDGSDNILTEEDTGSAGNNIEDYVDTFSDNHSPTDIGSHSSSANLQDKDTNMDILTEVDENSASNDEDFVDTNTNNHDPVDKGAYGDFNELKDIDSVTTTLTEVNTGGAGGSEWLDVNGLDLTWNDWDHNDGDSPYLDLQDQPTNVAHELSSANKLIGWFDFGATSLIGSGITVNISIYCANADGSGNDGFDVYYDVSGGGGTLLGWYQPDTTYAYITVVVGGTFSATEVNAFRIYLKTHNQGGGDDVYADHARIGTSQTALDNYEFDREFQFSSQDFNDDNEYLCIKTGTIPAETILIDVWTGSWENIGSIVDANDDTWVNISISTYLTGSGIEFRFVGNDESSDTTLSVWNLDGILIHTWDNANYRLDLEFRFASLDFDETTGEELCIFTGTINAETINIDIWDSAAWVNIGSIVDANDDTWVNISISAYLDASTEDFRFEDATKTSDSVEHTWNIDAILIHSWTDPVINYQFDREFSFSSLDFDETTGEELCIFTGTIGTETINIDVYDGTWTNIGLIIDANDDTWINISISAYLDSTTEYFRFIGNSESSDTTENTWGIDGILIHSWTDPVINYEFDRQFNFQSLDFDETTGEELCIKTGTIQSESLKVDVWHSAAWVNILTIVNADDNTWKNISISTYLDSTTEDFRFIGNSESGDTIQETWQIDGILIHSWTDPIPNYQFDREFNFSSIDFNEQNEFLCVRTGTIQAESLKVDVWDGSWITILTIINPNDDTWLNISISDYLDSVDENFRFVGNSESGDTNQESWEIDSVLLHTWNITVLDYELDWESQIQSIANNEFYNLTIYGNYSDNENVSIQLWNYTDSSWVDSGQDITINEIWYNISLDSLNGIIDESVTVRYLANNQSLDDVLSILMLDYVGISSWNISAGSNDPPQIIDWFEPSTLIDPNADVPFDYLVIYDTDNNSAELTVRFYYTNDSFGSVNISVDMIYVGISSPDHYRFTYLFDGKPAGTRYQYYYYVFDGNSSVYKPTEYQDLVLFDIEWDAAPVVPPEDDTTTTATTNPSTVTNGALNPNPIQDNIIWLLFIIFGFMILSLLIFKRR